MKFFLAAAAILAAITQGHEIEKRQAGNTSKKVVCYYTNWSVYRKGLAKYTPQNINPYLCTHLVYAFGGLTDEFEVGPFDSYQDIEQGGYAKFNGLKQYNKGLKTLLAIGGWNEGSGRFSELVSLPEYRKTFIISAIRHLRRYNFDGLDLDWEYPASRDGSAPEDKENYATLVRELRDAFEDEGRKVTKGRLLLTMAVPAGQNYIDKGYDVPSLSRDLDFINILNYDYHSAYEPNVNHHAAIMNRPGASEYEWNAQLNVDWTVKYYIELGADKHKLIIGIPTYGRSFTLIDGNFTDLGSSADGPGEQGKYTKENGFMAFYEVCENIASNGWEVRKPFPRRIGPYAYSGNQWVGYDDEKIVARKAEYVKEHDLGGIMYWSLDNDDFRGICNGEEYPLIEAGKKALFSGLDTSINEARNLQSSTTTAGTRAPSRLSTRLQNHRRPTQSRTTTKTTTTTITPRTTTRRTRPGGRRRQQGNRRRTSTTTIDPLNTPPPPTTPSPINSFACKREGFYPNPDNCHKYYWCLDSGASGLGIVAHAFSCPSDLVFSKSIDGCDHPTRTKCNTDKKSRGGGAGNTTPGSTTPIPTTTEIPVDYSYYDDDYYYYDDYEYDQVVDDLPKPVEEVSNTVGRQFQNSGGNQFQGPSSVDVLQEETSVSSGSLGGRTRPQYSTISRDRSRTPAAAETPREEVQSQQESSRGSTRPEYTTIQRVRPATPSPREEEEPASSRQTTTGGRNYVTIERRRPSTQVDDAATVEEPELSFSTEPTLEYVTLSRNRGSTTSSPFSTTSFSTDIISRESTSQGSVDKPTTPRYVTIQRNRPRTTEEPLALFEETTIVTTPVSLATPSSRPLLVHPLPTTTPFTSVYIEENLLHEVVSDSAVVVSSSPLPSLSGVGTPTALEVKRADETFIPVDSLKRNGSELTKTSNLHKVRQFNQLKPVPVVNSFPIVNLKISQTPKGILEPKVVSEAEGFLNTDLTDTLISSVHSPASLDSELNATSRREDKHEVKLNLVKPEIKFEPRLNLEHDVNRSEVPLLSKITNLQREEILNRKSSRNKLSDTSLPHEIESSSQAIITSFDTSLVKENEPSSNANISPLDITLAQENESISKTNFALSDTSLTSEIRSSSQANRVPVDTRVMQENNPISQANDVTSKRLLPKFSSVSNDDILPQTKIPKGELILHNDITTFEKSTNFTSHQIPLLKAADISQMPVDDLTSETGMEIIDKKVQKFVILPLDTFDSNVFTLFNNESAVQVDLSQKEDKSQLALNPTTQDLSLNKQSKTLVDLVPHNNTSKADFMHDTGVFPETSVLSLLNSSLATLKVTDPALDDSDIPTHLQNNMDLLSSTDDPSDPSLHLKVFGTGKFLVSEKGVMHDETSLHNVLDKDTPRVHGPGQTGVSSNQGDVKAEMVMVHGESSVGQKSLGSSLHDPLSPQAAVVAGVESDNFNYEDNYYYDDLLYSDLKTTHPDSLTSPLALSQATSTTSATTTPSPTITTTSYSTTTTHKSVRTRTHLRGRPNTSSRGSLSDLSENKKDHVPVSPQAVVDAGVDSDNFNYEDYYYYDELLYSDLETTLPDPLTSPMALPQTTSTTSTTTPKPPTTTTPEPTTTTTPEPTTTTTPKPPTTTTPEPTTTTTPEPTTTTTTSRPIRTRTRVRDRPNTSPRGSLSELSENDRDRDSLSTRLRLSSTSDQTSTVDDKEVKVEAAQEKIHHQIPVISRQPGNSSQVTRPPRRRVVVRKRVQANSHPEQVDEETTSPVRIRTRPPTTPRPTIPPSFNRPRPTRPRPPRPQGDARPRPQLVSRPTRPQSDGRPTRPQLISRPTRPQTDNRQTRPQAESLPTQDQGDARLRSQSDARPTRPFIVPRPRPTTALPTVAFEEETVDPFDDELFIDTTIIPETSVRPTLIPFSLRPQAITPKPQPTTPAPRLTTLAPRPTTPEPRPTTPAPRPTTPKPRPTTPAPILTTQAPRVRSRPSPRPRPRGTTPRPTTQRPRPRSPRPSRPPATRAPIVPQGPVASSILSNDYYDYYYDDLDGALTGTLGQLATLTDKAVLMADGSVQCYDTGYFAHPESCKKFISCSKTVRGLVRGWVYTCPDQLVFDPVGGMCNWAEAVDCAGPL